LAGGAVGNVLTAYLISEVSIDEQLAARYRALAETSIAHHGGRYLVRGATPEMLEGSRSSEERVVVVVFPSIEQARAWYGSDEYREARALSRRALHRRLTLVEGVDSA
jgi:uncharacterized protein (DUF1330 family)